VPEPTPPATEPSHAPAPGAVTTVDGGSEPRAAAAPGRSRTTAGSASTAEPDPSAPAPEPGAPGSRSQRLMEEGEVAADYLEELLDIADLDGDIDIDVENGRASVAVLADPAATRQLRRLVGPDGSVLEALQELTRLAVQAQTGERSRLMLDVAGHRAQRRESLVRLANEAAETVRRSGEPLRLEPMSPFERKVVHDAIAAAGLSSESEGVEPERCVVVLPRAAGD
jgi:spoIIIJ-associated protein